MKIANYDSLDLQINVGLDNLSIPLKSEWNMPYILDSKNWTMPTATKREKYTDKNEGGLTTGK